MLILDRKQLVSHINSKVSIVDIVARYVQLTKSGRNHKGLCPFHNEVTPSFLVSEEKGIYKCFGCGEGGDGISFFSKMEGITYGEALGRLAENVGVDPMALKHLKQKNQQYNFEQEYGILKFARGFYQYYLLNTEEGNAALDYLSGRDITKEIITQFGIGLAPRDGSLIIRALTSNSFSLENAKNVGLVRQNDRGDYFSLFKSRIMFSVTNEQGHVVGFSGRIYLSNEEGEAKYINSPESKVFQKSQLIYNVYEAKKNARSSGRIFLFEGFLDVIAAYKVGFVESVATMGTSVTVDHAKILSRHAREVILVFDGDQAGLAGVLKAIPILFSAGLQVRVVHIPNGLDPDAYIKQHGIDKFTNLVKHSFGGIDFGYEYLKQGVRLDTADGQIEFERRLRNFANQLSERTLSQALLRKFRNEMNERHRHQANDSSQKSGLYRGRFHDRQAFSFASKLQVVSGEVKAEKELIYYVLLDKQVFELVVSRVGTAFNIDVHRKIMQAIEAYYVKNDVMIQEEFLSSLDPFMMRVVCEVIEELKNRPKIWSKKMIIELTDKVQMGAKKLAHAGKKQMFLDASYDEQLSMMGELTVGLVVN